MLYVLDNVLGDIAEVIAAHPPERGGALLGLVGKPVVTRFLFDERAQTTGSSYRPSRILAELVKKTELLDRVEFKGIVHSHPAGMSYPSSQDEYELAVGLEINPHMPFYLAPIVTSAPLVRELGPHELAVGSGRISFFAAYRHKEGTVVKPLPAVTEVPMQQDLERIRAVYGGSAPPEVFLTNLGGVEMLGGRVILEGGLELLFLASELYPAIAPLLLVTAGGGNTEQVEIPWQIDTPADQRLVEAVRHLLISPGPYRKCYGPPNGPALTTDSERARLAGWEVRYTGQNPQAAADQIWRGLFARSNGILSEQIRAKRILVAGAGSVGSYLVEQLARSGITDFTLIDHDSVELPNLSRTIYDLKDLGRPKVEAAARRLLQINPLATLNLHVKNISDFEPEELDKLVKQVDLVVAATDDPQAQRALNRFAYANDKPALFVGLYAGAQGGEVVISIPDRTPCYLCATLARHDLEAETAQVSGDVDYGTGRLKGEVALGADIHHVTSAAIKIALSLLLPSDAEAQLKGFVEAAINEGSTYLTLSMTSNYWFYPHIFGDTPGQYAYQSVWLTPICKPDCPVCGDPEYRIGPLEVPLRSPRVKGVRRWDAL